jgi:DnaJ-class molecular chaperone
MTTCPHCEGPKKVGAFVDGVRNGKRWGAFEQIPCFTCNGTGEVTPEHMARICEGKRRREDRKARGLSLRQESVRLGISMQELSEIERGR